MGMFDNIKDKVQGLVDEHGDKAGVGLDKAGDFVDEKTGGQHSAQIDGGVRGQERAGRPRRAGRRHPLSHPDPEGDLPGDQSRQIITTARSSVSPARADAQSRFAPPANPPRTRRSAAPSIRSTPTVRSRNRDSTTPSV